MKILKFKVSPIILLLFYLCYEFGYSDCSPYRAVIKKIQNVPLKYQESLKELQLTENLSNFSVINKNLELLKQKIGFALSKLTSFKESDLIFILDSSASIGHKNFLSFLRFLKRFIANFNISYNGTRIAVISFSSKEQVARKLDYISRPSIDINKCKIFQEDLPHIAFTQYFGGGTYTFGALSSAKDVFMYSRQSAQKVVILMSDGFSNGDDPRPLANSLIESGVQIFSFGIKRGNTNELKAMSSEPKDEHCFIFDSFENMDTLVIHKNDNEVKSRGFQIQSEESCNLLCKEHAECCDVNAKCVCNITTGTYSCVCQTGYYGTGFKGDCNEFSCPELQYPVFNKLFNRMECECKKGYIKVNDKCEVVKCPKLEPPNNGFFSSDCSNVYNAACGVICKPGYQLKGTSIRICKENATWDGLETKCIVKRCPKLVAPQNGSINCTTNNFTFETVCHFDCDFGFQLQGSRKRSCLAIALWDGLPVVCKAITPFA